MELTPELVLKAYCSGVFPMAEGRNSDEVYWYDPEVRGVLPIEELHVSKKLKKTILKKTYTITFDKAFADVISKCADIRKDTWINDEIISLYTKLHDAGYAHSVEAWLDGELVGGLYGISIGGAFFGESMFSTATDASKVALVYLVARLWKQGFTLLDAQFVNEHLKQFGIKEILKNNYMVFLEQALKLEVSFNKGYSLSEKLDPVSSESTSFSTGMLDKGCLLSGAASSINSSGDSDVKLFLQSTTQTS